MKVSDLKNKHRNKIHDLTLYGERMRGTARQMAEKLEELAEKMPERTQEILQYREFFLKGEDQ